MRPWFPVLLVTCALLVACGDGSSNPQSTPTSIDEELRQLAANVSEEPARIEFDLNSSTDNGTLTFFWRPPATWRTDFAGPNTNGSLIAKEGTAYACAVVSGQGSCVENTTAAAQFPLLSFYTDPDTFTDLIDTEIQGIDFGRTERQIAGLDATCFAGSGEISDQEGSAEYCFTATGLLLRLAGGSASGTFELNATSVTEQVSDADFQLPYPPG